MQTNNKIKTPIIIFVYNRPMHTSKTLEALKNNYLADKSNLYVFSDGPAQDKDKPAVDEVRKIIDNINGFNNKEIILRDKNFGLANNIISGVTEIINKFEKVIVLEDDLVTSPAFLYYMNQMLDFYEEYPEIFSITGSNYSKKLLKIPYHYPYDIYFNPRPSSWGWATWKSVWNKVDWEISDFQSFSKDRKRQKAFNITGPDKTEMLFRQMRGKIDSWAIRWDYHHFKHNGLCVYPVDSFIENIGNDGSGRHARKSKQFLIEELNKNTEYNLPIKVKTDKQIIKNFRRVYNVNKKLVIKRFINRFLNYRL